MDRLGREGEGARPERRLEKAGGELQTENPLPSDSFRK